MGDGTGRLTRDMLVDYLRASAASRKQARELFTRIQATVSLMMTNMNADHPYATHLSRIERLAQRGIELPHPAKPPPPGETKGAKRTTPPPPGKTAPPSEMEKRGRGVLLADGNDMFLNIGKQMLEATGYRVLTAKTGEDTLKTYREKQDAIDLVILGLVTPETAETVAVYKDLRHLDPDLAILISNGYGLDGQTSRILDDRRSAFMERPFSITELSRKIRSLLDPPAEH